MAITQRQPHEEDFGIIDRDEAGPRPRGGVGQRMLILVCAVAAVVAIVAGVGAFLAGRSGGQDAASSGKTSGDVAGATGEPVSGGAEAGSAEDMSAVAWRGAALPISAIAGPTKMDADTASGFQRSKLGASLAAVHLSVRIDPHAGRASFEKTIRDQISGDSSELLQSVAATYAALAERAGVVDGGPIVAPTGAISAWRVDQFDPKKPVTVHLRVELPAGGARDFAVAVVWEDGDWKLVAPTGDSAFAITDPAGTYEPFAA